MTSDDKHINEYAVAAVEENVISFRPSVPVSLTGPEMAKLMTKGTRVVRGPDWKWANQVLLSMTQTSIIYTKGLFVVLNRL